MMTSSPGSASDQAPGLGEPIVADSLDGRTSSFSSLSVCPISGDQPGPGAFARVILLWVFPQVDIMH